MFFSFRASSSPQVFTNQPPSRNLECTFLLTREERIDSDAGILWENTGLDLAMSGKINQTHNLLPFSFIPFFIYFYVLLIFYIFARLAAVRATPDVRPLAANQKRLGQLAVAPLTGPQVLAQHHKSSFSFHFCANVKIWIDSTRTSAVIMWALSIKTNGVAGTEFGWRQKVWQGKVFTSEKLQRRGTTQNSIKEQKKEKNS